MPVKKVTKVVALLKFIICCQAVYYNNNEMTANGDCPPWYFRDDEGKCSFSNTLGAYVNQFDNTSELHIGNCMTVTNTSQVVAQSPYSPMSDIDLSHLYQVLPSTLDEVNDSVCGPLNRKGFLCSECKESYGLAAYRYYGLMCVKCNGSPWKWIGYIMLLCIPQTIFFLTFLLLRINVHSGSLTGFIFFAHTIITTVFFYPLCMSFSQSVFGYWPTQIVLALYGVWSLNFMRFIIPPFCVSPHLTTLQLVSLGYVSSVFPLILCIATYYLIQLHDRGNWLIVTLWRPFHSKSRSGVESSIIHTFGTFILLSYGNNVFVSFSLIQSSVLVALDVSTNTLKSLPPRSIDLGVDYFGPTHAPYGVLGIMGGLLTVILPLVLVLIYPTRVFPKLITCCGLRRWHVTVY